MSHIWVLTGLMELDDLESKFRKLFFSHGLPEITTIDPEWMTLSDVEDFFREPQQGIQDDLQDFTVTIQFGKHVVGRPYLEQNWLKLILNPKPKLQVKDTYLFQIEVPTSEGHHFSSRGFWSSIEKIVLSLEPYFVFSSDYANVVGHAIDKKHEDILERPWEYYWSTVIYGQQFAEKIDIQNADFLGDIYYHKVLENSYIWISSPYGLGNERPYEYIARDFDGNIVDITEPKISEFIWLSGEKHVHYLKRLLELK